MRNFQVNRSTATLKPLQQEDGVAASKFNERFRPDKDRPDPKEETTTLRAAQRGDPKALDRLRAMYYKFIFRVALSSFVNHGVPLEDLLNSGWIGLQRALEKYNPENSAKFLSYAVWWIFQAMGQTIRDEGHTVRLPANLVTLLAKLLSAMSELENSGINNPSVELLASMANIDLAIAKKVLSCAGKPISLDSTGVDNPEGGTLHNIIPGKSWEDPYKNLDKENLQKSFKKILEGYDNRTREIMEMYFGLNGKSQETLEIIGKDKGLTRERVRQLVNKTLRSLRIRAKHLELYVR